MERYRPDDAVLLLVILSLLMSGLTGCCLFGRDQRAVLSGNTIQAVYSTASPNKRVLTSYRIGPEALERLLEKAEACKK